MSFQLECFRRKMELDILQLQKDILMSKLPNIATLESFSFREYNGVFEIINFNIVVNVSIKEIYKLQNVLLFLEQDRNNDPIIPIHDYNLLMNIVKRRILELESE